MTENVDRFGNIRRAVSAAKNLGISDRGERREAVINAVSAQKKGILQISEEEAANFPSVAKFDIRQESQEVIDTSINKYLTVKEGLEKTPVLVDAIHAIRPPFGDAKDRDEYDEFTSEIASRVAELTGASLIIAKKSRLTSDLNRAWWTREQRSTTKSFEYPRSARAALYWAVRGILASTNRLDENEQLKSKFCRITIHGMKDHDDFDFAIAGSQDPADEEFIAWFFARFKESLSQTGIEPKVVVAKLGDKTEPYSGPTSLAYFRRTPRKIF